MEKDFQVNFDNLMNNVLDAISDFQKKTGCRVVEIHEGCGAGRGLSSFKIAGKSAQGHFFEVKSKFSNERLAMDS